MHIVTKLSLIIIYSILLSHNYCVHTITNPSTNDTFHSITIEDISGFWEGTFINSLYYSYAINPNNNTHYSQNKYHNSFSDIITNCTFSLSEKCRNSLPPSYISLIIDAEKSEIHSLMTFNGSEHIDGAKKQFPVCVEDDGIFPAAISSFDTKCNVKYDHKKQYLHMSGIMFHEDDNKNQKEFKFEEIPSCNQFEIFIQNVIKLLYTVI